jgi:hypothetical protein
MEMALRQKAEVGECRALGAEIGRRSFVAGAMIDTDCSGRLNSIPK